jgi:hypothetical protein
VALSSRQSAAVAALSRIWRDVDVSALGDAAQLMWQAAGAADTPGRVIAAANQVLPRPEDAIAALWQAATTLREHRGDGHVAALVTTGITPCQSHLLKIGAGESETEPLRLSRGWPDEEWAAAADELNARGWTGPNGELTDAGNAARAEVETSTDLAAATPWQALGPGNTERLAELLGPLAAAVIDAGAFPSHNPVGLSEPREQRAF